MNRLTVSRQAVSDLEAIAEYIAVSNPTAALRVLDALQASFQSLACTPSIGQSLEHLRPNLRAFPAKHPANRYVVFYFVLNDRVEICTVLHGARDWITLFEHGER